MSDGDGERTGEHDDQQQHERKSEKWGSEIEDLVRTRRGRAWVLLLYHYIGLPKGTSTIYLLASQVEHSLHPRMDIVTDEEGMGAVTWLGRYFWY
jgi:hypothetical protein